VGIWRAYSKRLSEKKSREMSDILSATVQETGNDESRNSCTSTNTSASTKCHVSDFITVELFMLLIANPVPGRP
jgi:hypothetical protein